MRKKYIKVITFFAVTLFIFCIGIIAYVYFIKPSNSRAWSLDNAVLPYAEVNGDLVAIHNIRNFTYKSVMDYAPAYYDKTFDVSKIKTADFFVEPFGSFAAHTFLSFGFEDGSHIAVSVEVRREMGEEFSAFKGLFKKFEIMYVLADEKDVVKLRTNYRRGDVYMYPILATQEKIRTLFVDILARVDKLKTDPEFYNTLTNNCTNNIVHHVNDISPRKVPLSIKYILPGYAGELAYELGLINAIGTFEEIQNKSNITAKAQACGDCINFSEVIRE